MNEIEYSFTAGITLLLSNSGCTANASPINLTLTSRNAHALNCGSLLGLCKQVVAHNHLFSYVIMNSHMINTLFQGEQRILQKLPSVHFSEIYMYMNLPTPISCILWEGKKL